MFDVIKRSTDVIQHRRIAHFGKKFQTKFMIYHPAVEVAKCKTPITVDSGSINAAHICECLHARLRNLSGEYECTEHIVLSKASLPTLNRYQLSC